MKWWYFHYLQSLISVTSPQIIFQDKFMIKPLLDNSCGLIECGYRVMVRDQGGGLLLVTI